ncbi:MAG: PAS domain S-box protein [Pseudomonadota bacterium]
MEDRTEQLLRAMEMLEQEVARRVGVESALARSETRYRTLVETARDVIFALSPDLKCTYVSPSVTDVLGYSVSEIPAMSVMDLLSAKSRMVVEKAIRDRAGGGSATTDPQGRPDPLELEIRNKDGTIVWAEVNVSFIEEENIRPGEILGILRDVTARKKAQALLRESEERYRSVTESAPDPMVVYDMKGLVTYVNPAFTALFGWTIEELRGRRTDYIPEEYLEETRARIERIINGDTIPGFESRRYTKTGELIDVNVNAAIFRDTVGRPAGCVVTLQDIGERKRAQEALIESEMRYRKLMEHLPDAVGVHRDGIIVFANPAAAALVGAESPQQLIGKKVSVFVHPDDRVDPAASAALSGTAPRNAPLLKQRLLRMDGETVHVEAATIPMLFEGSRALLTAVRDVTERMRAEQAVLRLNEDLERRVRERTAELEAANRELMEFAYVVSHDLKAPLRAIGQLTEWIAQDYAEAFDEKGRKKIALLLGRVKRMRNLLEGILEYSRIGRVREAKQITDLNKLVRDVVFLLAPPENIEVIIEGTLPTVRCEATRMEQLFQNLLDNAIKFMDKPKGEIRISCVQEGYVHTCRVSDNGPGIEEKYLGKIFQVFQTLRPRDRFESTGIGLALVKRIVEINGGSIWVESKKGLGTSFLFTLPGNGVEE